MAINDSECNQKKPIFTQDIFQITNKSDLPIQSIKYGQLEFESEQMNVVIGPIICQKQQTTGCGICLSNPI